MSQNKHFEQFSKYFVVDFSEIVLKWQTLKMGKSDFFHS